MYKEHSQKPYPKPTLGSAPKSRSGENHVFDSLDANLAIYGITKLREWSQRLRLDELV